MIRSNEIAIVTAPTRKIIFKPLSRSGVLFCTKPRIAGATAIPTIWKKKMAPTATPNRCFGTANCATRVVTVGMTPKPRPAIEVTRTYNQIGVSAVKRHMANIAAVTTA